MIKYVPVISTIVTVATPGIPTMWLLVIEAMEILNVSSSSNISSSFIIISKEALVDPTGNMISRDSKS